MADHALQKVLAYALGVVTLAAVGFGVFEIFRVLERGPEAGRFRVYVLFKDARGVRPGTRILHRGMEVGQVAALTLDGEAGRVRAHIDLAPAAGPLVRSTTQIWIVRPRFGGLAGEMSGLDTLIKESYLRLRVRPTGERLHSGQELLGMEAPPADLGTDALEDPELGDLLASVVLPERHGLVVGSPVLYRGMAVGEVRRLGFTEDARGVFASFRVERAMRTTVREKSRFWASRPILHGSLLAGVTLDDLGSLLLPALAYDSRDAWNSEPAADDSVFIGLERPPDALEDWNRSAVSPRLMNEAPRELATLAATLEPWVQVRYRAVDKDLLSADDEVSATGEGVLYLSGDGRLLVLTGRDLCDGEFFAQTGFLDSLDLVNERLRIVLADGRVFPARRIWIAPDDQDLALLSVQLPHGQLPLPLPRASGYLVFSPLAPGGGAAAAGEASRPQQDGAESSAGDEAGVPPASRGLIKTGGRAIGWRGHLYRDPEKTLRIGFDVVPPELRPHARGGAP